MKDISITIHLPTDHHNYFRAAAFALVGDMKPQSTQITEWFKSDSASLVAELVCQELDKNVSRSS